MNEVMNVKEDYQTRRSPKFPTLNLHYQILQTSTKSIRVECLFPNSVSRTILGRLRVCGSSQQERANNLEHSIQIYIQSDLSFRLYLFT